jgi:hypothetical protein
MGLERRPLSTMARSRAALFFTGALNAALLFELACEKEEPRALSGTSTTPTFAVAVSSFTSATSTSPNTATATATATGNAGTTATGTTATVTAAKAPPAATGATTRPRSDAGKDGAADAESEARLEAPLQAWMKREMVPALSAKDYVVLAEQFRALKTAPAGAAFVNWTSIAKDGEQASTLQRDEGIRAACKACHVQAKTTFAQSPSLRATYRPQTR